jgi:hypothetical protein
LIIKGSSTSGADALAKHLKRQDTNDRRNETLDLKGVAAGDLAGALREMEAVASGNPNCKKPLYHASINTLAEERLTDEQKLKAVDRLERELGLTGQPRAVVVHEKKDGREHIHVVWSRIDIETLRVTSDSHNFRKHELVARELEREFGLTRVQGVHIERDGKDRPERAASHKEYQQQERTGVSAKQAKGQISAIWRATDTGRTFQQALSEKGWILARGDRRDFVVVDKFGGVHSLSRRIDGAKAADVRSRLADIDPKTLASAADARGVQVARLSEREREAQRTRERTAQGRLERATSPRDQKGRTASRGRTEISATRAAGRAAGGILKSVGKIADKAASLAESFLGGGPSKPHIGERARAREEGIPLDQGQPLASKENEERLRQIEQQQSVRRQQYLRDFDREVPDERQRDADLTRGGQEGGRERKRGE